MAAVLNVMHDFGGSDGTPGTEQNTDGLGPPNIRFKTADDATVDTNNPIPIPGSGSKYSFWKQIYLKVATAPAVQVDNIRFFMTGTGFPTGVTLWVGLQFPVKTSTADTGYEVATGTVGDSGDTMHTGASKHGDITTRADAESYSEGSPLANITIGEAGSVLDAIGETSHYMVFQMEVASTASAGDLDNQTMNWKVDEI